MINSNLTLKTKKEMDKLKSDIEIIDWLNILDWIDEVKVSSAEIVGKISSSITSLYRKE